MNMKKLFLIFCLLSASLSANAQWSMDEFCPPDKCILLTKAPDIVYYYLDEGRRSHHIRLFEKEEVYAIDISVWFSNDNGGGIFFSSGFFKKRGGHIYLYDTSTGLEMNTVVKGGKLTFLEGYELLKNKEFIQTDRWRHSQDMRILTDHHVVENIRDSLYLGDFPAMVEPGVYSSFQGGDTKLYLRDDGTFSYDFEYYVSDMKHYTYSLTVLHILDGTWSQKGNLVILHDKHTDHNYYLICWETGLLPVRLPGSWNFYSLSGDMYDILLKAK